MTLTMIELWWFWWYCWNWVMLILMN